jgi:transcriptional regulator GlxA family with amidase domain
MKRRTFFTRTLGATTLAVFGPVGCNAETAPPKPAAAGTGTGKLAPLPERRTTKIAFLLGDNANVMDTAGPWEVFQDVEVDALVGKRSPFELYTVGPSEDILTMTGGLKVKPHYSIANAPQPNVIVVPAQRATDETRAWLRTAAAKTDVTVSICTGAQHLARVGLLDGMAATTHHEFFDAFAKEFPNIELRRGLRFVDNGRIATAGGLTSGIDMALHIVARYFGEETAATTAHYMEYTSEAWKVGKS